MRKAGVVVVASRCHSSGISVERSFLASDKLQKERSLDYEHSKAHFISSSTDTSKSTGDQLDLAFLKKLILAL